MATVRDVALPLATICTPVPRAGDGICDRCHRPPNPTYTRCWSCEQVEGHPGYNEDFWKRQSRLVFDFDVCCVGDHS